MAQLRLYFDEDAMDYDLIEPLRARGLDVLTALEAKRLNRDDEDHLAFATEHNRSLYSFNVAHYCRLHGEWVEAQKTHAGIVIAQQRLPIGRQLRCILHLVSAKSAEEMRDSLEFLASWG
jgi:hypothetical protein